ncbi:Alba DNA/RNA-binding protein [Zea mays]|uniref:Alba DNA/RNA-binding protein n=1 Tax=Zea mays TaxID=4577 RepID=A0A1D6FF19_MAIZE|nr:Alba DNA/RNA-binding protein [Zea mays]
MGNQRYQPTRPSICPCQLRHWWQAHLCHGNGGTIDLDLNRSSADLRVHGSTRAQEAEGRRSREVAGSSMQGENRRDGKRVTMLIVDERRRMNRGGGVREPYRQIR